VTGRQTAPPTRNANLASRAGRAPSPPRCRQPSSERRRTRSASDDRPQTRAGGQHIKRDRGCRIPTNRARRAQDERRVTERPHESTSTSAVRAVQTPLAHKVIRGKRPSKLIPSPGRMGSRLGEHPARKVIQQRPQSLSERDSTYPGRAAASKYRSITGAQWTQSRCLRAYPAPQMPQESHNAALPT